LPSFSKITFLYIPLLFAIMAAALLLYGCVISNTVLGLTHQDRAFSNSLEAALSEAGKKVRVDVVHPGDWALVCFIAPYDRPSKIAAEVLGIPQSDIIFINSADSLASDDLWGFAFLRPPRSIEYLQVHSSLFYSGDSTACIARETAFFEAREILRSSKRRLQLIDN
jgi:hypothetical protein